MAEYKFVDDTQEILIKILKSINYPEDIEVAVNEFMNAITIKSFLKLFPKLTLEQQNKFITRLNKKEIDTVAAEFRSDFTEDVMKKEFLTSFKEQVTDFLEKTGGNYTDEQLQQIDQLLDDPNIQIPA